MALIEVEKLNFSYPLQLKKTINNVSLTIESGEFVVLCGASGCGKSTFLKHLKRELTPHGEKSGSIRYKEVSYDQLDDRTAASQIGFVMQNPENQIVTDKVWHELAFGLENIGLDTMVIRRRVAEMANFFGIHTWYHKKTNELSGGQKQLLNLAAIMAMQPTVLILDEPTSQLDPIAATEFIATLHKLNKDLGLTIILVEHRLEEVYSIADRVIVMEDGGIICNGEPEAVAKQLKRVEDKHIMLLGLPTPIRVYHALDIEGTVPLTVRDGRRWLSKHFKKDTSIHQQEYTRGELILEVKDAWFRYEKEMTDVLRGFNLRIHKGDIISILGGNGTGKTTALQVMAGLFKPYRGKISLNGKKISSYKNSELYRNNIAVLPQNPQSLFVENKVRKEFQSVIKASGLSKAEGEKRIEDIVQTLDIQHLLENHPYDLSGGEQQKAALAKILLLNPKIIFMDEPTKGIDAYSKQILATILTDLKKKGVTIVLVTHDIEFSAEYSDQCALFFDGNIVSEDSSKLFYSGNNFYTTAAHRMSRHLFEQAITSKEVIERCKANLDLEKKLVSTSGI